MVSALVYCRGGQGSFPRKVEFFMRLNKANQKNNFFFKPYVD